MRRNVASMHALRKLVGLAEDQVSVPTAAGGWAANGQRPKDQTSDALGAKE
jgi:hypothetical protein